MNLPNLLSVARIILVPLLVSVMLTKFEGRQVLGLPVELVAAAIFGLAAITDWLDGYLARRRQQITSLGQMLDPLADKLLISATLISLVQLDMVSAWMVAVIIGREFVVTGLRHRAFARGTPMPASRAGKAKMISQIVAILLLLLGGERVPLFVWLGRAAMWVVMGTALYSAFHYYREYLRLTPSGDRASVVPPSRDERG